MSLMCCFSSCPTHRRTWVDDPALVALAVAHGRILRLDRIWLGRKTNDDWREWIYLSIMEYL